LEIGERLPFPFVQRSRDLMNQDVPAPSVLEGCPEVPFAALAVFEPVEQDHVMSPGQFCSKVLHFLSWSSSLSFSGESAMLSCILLHDFRKLCQIVVDHFAMGQRNVADRMCHRNGLTHG
jgi:hypothetical protein